MPNDLTPIPPDILAMSDGYYRHYKGGLYKVLTVARNSETKEVEIVYQSVDHPDEAPWTRAATTGPAPFLGLAQVGGDGILTGAVARFTAVSPPNKDQ